MKTEERSVACFAPTHAPSVCQRMSSRVARPRVSACKLAEGCDCSVCCSSVVFSVWSATNLTVYISIGL